MSLSLVEALVRRQRCPTDGAKLRPMDGWCRVCNSTWFPLLTGTAAPDAEPLESRDYLRRKLRELDQHKLKPDAAPPRALSRLQGGGTLFPRSADTPVVGRRYR